jgi:hypothetical protein
MQLWLLFKSSSRNVSASCTSVSLSEFVLFLCATPPAQQTQQQTQQQSADKAFRSAQRLQTAEEAGNTEAACNYSARSTNKGKFIAVLLMHRMQAVLMITLNGG